MREISTIDALWLELNEVSKDVPKGTHFEVDRRMNRSHDFGLKVRKRKICKMDVGPNHQTLRRMIKHYKDVIAEKQNNGTKSNVGSNAGSRTEPSQVVLEAPNK